MTTQEEIDRLASERLLAVLASARTKITDDMATETAALDEDYLESLKSNKNKFATEMNALNSEYDQQPSSVDVESWLNEHDKKIKVLTDTFDKGRADSKRKHENEKGKLTAVSRACFQFLDEREASLRGEPKEHDVLTVDDESSLSDTDHANVPGDDVSEGDVSSIASTKTDFDNESKDDFDDDLQIPEDVGRVEPNLAATRTSDNVTVVSGFGVRPPNDDSESELSDDIDDTVEESTSRASDTNRSVNFATDTQAALAAHLGINTWIKILKMDGDHLQAMMKGEGVDLINNNRNFANVRTYLKMAPHQKFLTSHRSALDQDKIKGTNTGRKASGKDLFKHYVALVFGVKEPGSY